MIDLASKVLLLDSVPYGNLARYVLHQLPAFVYYQKDNKIAKITAGEEILVPMTESDVNWDEILFQMLNMSVENNSDRDKVVKNLHNLTSYFDDKYIDAKQIITHPSFPHPVVSRFVKVHTSLLCSENTVFVLPEPQYLGVFATRDDRKEYGMSIICPQYVVRHTIE